MNITVTNTKAGGRIVEAVVGNQKFSRYTHPCRAHNVERFKRDVFQVASAMNGIPQKQVIVRLVT